MDQTWKYLVFVAILVTAPKSALCFGRNDAEGVLDSQNSFDYSDPETLDNLKKRLSSFVRIGRTLSSFIRIGKPYPGPGLMEEGPDGAGEISDAADKRNSAFVRIGKGEYLQPEKRLSSFVRIGRGNMDEFAPEEKRGAAFIRLGKFPSSAFMRNRGGVMRNYAPAPYYRRTGRIGHSSFIRIGKRDTRDNIPPSPANRFDRYIRLEDQLTEPNQISGDDIKRIGSSFVRIGRHPAILTADQFSRLLDMYRPEKRLSSFVRIGKSGNTDAMEKLMAMENQDSANQEGTDKGNIEIFTKSDGVQDE